MNGYSFWEAFWKRRQKEAFLDKDLNPKEKHHYSVLNIMNYIGLFIVVFVIVPIIIFTKEIPQFGWNVAFANVLAGVIRQNYRRVKLIKYGYYKKPALIGNIFQIIILIGSFLITIIGILFFALFISAYISA